MIKFSAFLLGYAIQNVAGATFSGESFSATRLAEKLHLLGHLGHVPSQVNVLLEEIDAGVVGLVQTVRECPLAGVTGNVSLRKSIKRLNEFRGQLMPSLLESAGTELSIDKTVDIVPILRFHQNLHIIYEIINRAVVHCKEYAPHASKIPSLICAEPSLVDHYACFGRLRGLQSILEGILCIVPRSNYGSPKFEVGRFITGRSDGDVAVEGVLKSQINQWIVGEFEEIMKQSWALDNSLMSKLSLALAISVDKGDFNDYTKFRTLISYIKEQLDESRRLLSTLDECIRQSDQLFKDEQKADISNTIRLRRSYLQRDVWPHLRVFAQASVHLIEIYSIPASESQSEPDHDFLLNSTAERMKRLEDFVDGGLKVLEVVKTSYNPDEGGKLTDQDGIKYPLKELLKGFDEIQEFLDDNCAPDYWRRTRLRLEKGALTSDQIPPEHFTNIQRMVELLQKGENIVKATLEWLSCLSNTSHRLDLFEDIATGICLSLSLDSLLEVYPQFQCERPINLFPEQLLLSHLGTSVGLTSAKKATDSPEPTI